MHEGCLAAYVENELNGMLVSCHVSVKLAPEFFDPQRIDSVALPAGPAAGSTQGLVFRTGSRIGY